MTSYFEYNGIKSTEYGIRLLNRLEFITPQRDIDEVVILGRDGTLSIDNERMENVEKQIYFDVYVDKSEIEGTGDGSALHKKAVDINNWLSVKGFHEFKYSMYPDYVYKAKFTQPFQLSDTVRWLGKGVIRATFYPIMYFADRGNKTITSGTTINNDGTVIAKPLIKITTSESSLTLMNNGKEWIKLQNLNGGITIDSELQQAFYNGLPAMNNMLKLEERFPLLNLGENTITWSGTATVEITERTGVMLV